MAPESKSNKPTFLELEEGREEERLRAQGCLVE